MSIRGFLVTWNDFFRDISTIFAVLTAAGVAVLFTENADLSKVWWIAYPEIHTDLMPWLYLSGLILAVSFVLNLVGDVLGRKKTLRVEPAP